MVKKIFLIIVSFIIIWSLLPKNKYKTEITDFQLLTKEIENYLINNDIKFEKKMNLKEILIGINEELIENFYILNINEGSFEGDLILLELSNKHKEKIYKEDFKRVQNSLYALQDKSLRNTNNLNERIIIAESIVVNSSNLLYSITLTNSNTKKDIINIINKHILDGDYI